MLRKLVEVPPTVLELIVAEAAECDVPAHRTQERSRLAVSTSRWSWRAAKMAPTVATNGTVAADDGSGSRHSVRLLGALPRLRLVLRRADDHLCGALGVLELADDGVE